MVAVSNEFWRPAWRRCPSIADCFLLPHCLRDRVGMCGKLRFGRPALRRLRRLRHRRPEARSRAAGLFGDRCRRNLVVLLEGSGRRRRRHLWRRLSGFAGEILHRVGRSGRRRTWPCRCFGTAASIPRRKSAQIRELLEAEAVSLARRRRAATSPCCARRRGCSSSRCSAELLAPTSDRPELGSGTAHFAEGTAVGRGHRLGLASRKGANGCGPL